MLCHFSLLKESPGFSRGEVQVFSRYTEFTAALDSFHIHAAVVIRAYAVTLFVWVEGLAAVKAEY